MTMSIWEKIAEVPWWTYPVFFYLIKISLSATKPHYITLKQLLFIPSSFIVLSAIGMYFKIPLTAYHSFIWIGTVFIGIAIGWLHFFIFRIKAIKHTSQLYLPGNYSVIALTIGMFTAYCFGYPVSDLVSWLITPNAAPMLMGLYGLFTGLFIGRLIYAYRCIKHGPYRLEATSHPLAIQPLH